MFEVLISCPVLKPLHCQLELELYDVIPLVQVYHGLQGGRDIYSQSDDLIFLLNQFVRISESLCLNFKTTYRSYSEGDDVLLVAVLQDQQPAVLLVALVPAVDDLVAPPVNVDALAVTAGELLLSAARELQSGHVRLPVVAGRSVGLHQPVGPPKQQRVEPSLRRPHRPLLLPHHVQLPHVGRVVEADLGAGDANIEQLRGLVVPGHPVGVDVGVGAETSEGEVDLLPPVADTGNDLPWTRRASPVQPARSPVTDRDRFSSDQ